MPRSHTLSIVTGTCNRRHALADMIQSVRPDLDGIPYHFYVVDGNSNDGTQEWVQKQFDCTLIEEPRRMGAIHAYNHGFRRARGTYVAWLNDDCVLTGSIFKTALEQLEKDPKTGLVAFPWQDPGGEIHYDQVWLGIPRRGWRYANFGVTRRFLLEKLDGWNMDGKLSFYGGDSHYSMKVWNAGYKVSDLARGGYIKHLRLEDETRVRENNDSPVFYAYWHNWVKPPEQPMVFPD